MSVQYFSSVTSGNWNWKRMPINSCSLFLLWIDDQVLARNRGGLCRLIFRI